MFRTYCFKKYLGQANVSEIVKNTALTSLKEFADNEAKQLYASIMYTEHDLRSITNMPAEDALKIALEDHGIRLCNNDIWNYALRYDTNKVEALNAIMEERARRLKSLYPMVDLAFELKLGKVRGEYVISLQSNHEDYFTFMKKEPYILGEAAPIETIYGEMAGLEEVCETYYYDVYKVSMEDMMAFNSEYYASPKRRIAIVLPNTAVLKEAEKLEGWEAANWEPNPCIWIESREEIAKKMIDDVSWNVLIMERTGFDPEKMPDLKKSLKKIAAPLKGLMIRI